MFRGQHRHLHLVDIVGNTKFVVFLIIIFPLLFVRQGLDFTDTGYLLANYQQIFNEPASIGSSFRIWLTDILGGIWIYFFGDSLGLLGYRFAGVLLVYSSVYCSYLVLKGHFDKRHLLWGLLVSLIFINRSGYQFDYNSLTALFYVLSAYFILKGMQDNKNYLIFISAFLSGLNIFIRLPNVLGFLFVLCIFFAGHLNKTRFSVQVKQSIYYLAGYLSSIIVVFAVMHLLGHFEIYISTLKDTFIMLYDLKGYHSSDRLANTYLIQHKIVSAKTGVIILGLTVISVMLTLFSRFRNRFLQYLIILLTAFCLVYFNYDSYQIRFDMVAGALGILYPVLVCIIMDVGRNNKDLRLVSFVSILILVLAPQGSSEGILNSVYGMYIAMPLVFNYLWAVKSFKINIAWVTEPLINRLKIRLSDNEIKLIKIIAMIVFLVFTVKSAWFSTYRDSADRLAMAYKIDHSMLKGILTTKERTRVVDELLSVFPRYVRENDYLLAYEQVSLVYFLTKTRPYLYSSWPMLYSPEKNKKSLDRALQERTDLPVIVRARGNTEEYTWPKTKGLRHSYYFDGFRNIMDDFIKQNHYNVVWQNSFFEILSPAAEENAYDGQYQVFNSDSGL